MNDKFTVIKGSADTVDTNRIMRTIALHDCWERQYRNSVLRAAQKNKDIKSMADYPQDDLMKMAFSGIKYVCSWRDVKRANNRLGIEYQETLEKAQATFQVIDAIFAICGCLTLRNFVTTFPIEKYYDGEKWEEKDYFSTMNVLKDMDWNEQIGRDELSELLWDYYNEELRHAYMEYTSAMSAMYKAQTGKGIMEKFLEDRGVPAYTMDKETGIMKNNQTGDIVKPQKASHIHIVE